MLRDQVLDAARDFLIEHDCAQLHMGDVAHRVGVSRQTVYNEFGSKDGLAQALALREAERLLAKITRRLDEHAGDLIAGLESAIAFTLAAADDNPLLKAVLTGTGADPFLTTRAQPVLAIATQHLVDYYNAHWPDSTLDVQQRQTGMEAVVRLVISHLVAPSAASEEAARRTAWLASQIFEMEHTFTAERAAHAHAVAEAANPRIGRPVAYAADKIEYARLLKE